MRRSLRCNLRQLCASSRNKQAPVPDRGRRQQFPVANAAFARLIKERASDRAYQIAEVHAYRMEINEAFAWLDRAYNQKDVELFLILNDPLLQNLASDPRYKAFLRKMNFPE